MAKIEIFDPPMCCPTGVCGPSVDPLLPQFAADIEWLKAHGTDVRRYNMVQDPNAYASNDTVFEAMRRFGTQCLPLILVEGRIVSQGGYPSRTELAAFAGLESEQSVVTPAMESCINALRGGKLVFICLLAGGSEENEAALRGVREFQRDEQYSMAAHVVEIDARDPSEQEFIRELGIDPATKQPVTLFLVPPNAIVGRFVGPTKKRVLVETLQGALTRCRPGSGCCG